jgi:hypothetical protein
MAVKRHKLDMAIREDYCLLGIVSDEPAYRLCWLFNQAMGTAFRRSDDLKLYHRKLEGDQVFPLFLYLDDQSMLSYRIIGNRSDEGFFLDELKNLDFLVHIQGAFSEESVSAFIKQATEIREVRMCVPVDLDRVRNKERLLLW